MKYWKIALGIILATNLAVVLVVNVFGTLDSFYSYHYGNDYKKNVLVEVTEKMAFNTPVWTFATIAGTNASYGFYAPNVASQFGMVFSVFDINGKLIGTENGPRLNARESVHRFSLCISMMQDKLASDNKNVTLNDYLKVMLHQISMEIKSYYPNGYKVGAVVYLYEYPSLDEFRAGKELHLEPVDEFIF